MQIAIVIPTYNEASRLPDTLKDIAAYLRDYRGTRHFTIFIADDGSDDDTIQKALSMKSDLDLRVLPYSHRGKGGAIKQAMCDLYFENFDYYLMMDADNATRIAQQEKFELDGESVYIASRYSPKSKIAYLSEKGPGLLRLMMSKSMVRLSRIFLGLKYEDTQCGFKFFPRHSIYKLFRYQIDENWIFDAELLHIAAKRHVPVKTVPIVWIERAESKVRPVRDGLGSVLAFFKIFSRSLRGEYSGYK